jgi:hypothetical protein
MLTAVPVAQMMMKRLLDITICNKKIRIEGGRFFFMLQHQSPTYRGK